MYAIIKTGGKEYNIEVGGRIEVERLPGNSGDEVALDKVVLVADKDDVKLGKPFISGAKVTAEIVKQKRGDKIIVFKRKPKKGYKRKLGHRQELTELKIKEIKA